MSDEQLPLEFELFRDVESDKSNVIYLWDCAPKFFPATSVKDHSKVITREYTLNGVTFSAEISPAIFERDGETVHRIPGEREEFVESAIRRIAEQEEYSKWHETSNTVQVFFTVTMLKRLLKDLGHSYNHYEIQEALMILRRAGITIKQASTKDGYKNLTQVENFLNQYSSAEDSDTRYVSVMLHPLVGKGIISHEFRSIDESTYFGIRNQLGRFMYRRMCAMWSGAGPDSPYSPKLVSFLEQSPRGLSKEMKQNTRAMRQALTALQDANVVKDWNETPEKVGRALKNVQFQIYPTEAFIAHWKESHNRHRRQKQSISRRKLAQLRSEISS